MMQYTNGVVKAHKVQSVEINTTQEQNLDMFYAK